MNKRKNQKSTLIGRISTTSKGGGYIDDIDPKKDSVFIEPGFLNTALNGDLVEVARSRDGRAKVAHVISRAKDIFVGRLAIEKGVFVLIPDDRKMYTNISLPLTEKNREVNISGQKISLNENLKVLVKMSAWTDPNVLPKGEIQRVLGDKGVNDVEMESIILEKGFDMRYPADVMKQAEEIKKNFGDIKNEEVAKRRDMRNVSTYTIDPFDAKDFDDAISFRKLSDDETSKLGLEMPLYEIGVHIADVSHYVRERSALDVEALKRGCSVYLVDRTIPMLPEVLSNDLCSLKPNEDKLAFSAIFVMDDRAVLKSKWFGRTVIRSIHRFTYETAQAAMDNKAKNVLEYSNNIQSESSAEAGMKYREDLLVLNRLAKIMAKHKFSKGAIEFEQDEIKFQLNDKGEPIGVYKKQRLDAHKLVEEYMLLANREVAKFIFDSNKQRGHGGIYRIHDVPDKDKIRNLSFFVKALGYNLSTKDGVVTARALNDLLDQIEDTPHESLIRTATIRSMQKAVYSTKNVGHFGLAFEFYTHFTSPIRRYPDILVHRILARCLDDKNKTKDGDIENLQKMSESSTDREIDAADAERTSIKLKQVEYMSKHIGEIFNGTISGVTKWGLYIEDEETKSEGMVHISELGEDYFNFDERSYSIVGEKSKKKYTLGDVVKFKVVSADLDKRMLEYALI